MSADDIFDQGSRPMPDFVRRGLVRLKSGNLYLKAPYAVLWMREEHPDWGIETELLEHDADAGFALFKATIRDADGRVLATAHGDASRSAIPYIRKAETNAISRALGNCGYGTIYGESIDEEEYAESTSAGNGYERQPAPASRPAGPMPINESGGPCVSCHAPDGKAHTRQCKLVKGTS